MGKIKKAPAPAPAAQTMFYNVDLLDAVKRREEVRNNFMNGVTFSNNLKKNAGSLESVLQKETKPVTPASSLRVDTNRLRKSPMRNPSDVRKDGSVKLSVAANETANNPLMRNKVTINPQAEVRDTYADIGGLDNHLSVLQNLPTRSTDINNAKLLLGKKNLNDILSEQKNTINPKNDRLNTMTLETRGPGSRGWTGLYYPGENREYVTGIDASDMEQTARHELTHARQDSNVQTGSAYSIEQPWASRPDEIHAVVSAAKQRYIKNGFFKNPKNYDQDIESAMNDPHIGLILQELYKKYDRTEADNKVKSLFKVIAKKDSNTDSDNLV